VAELLEVSPIWVPDILSRRRYLWVATEPPRWARCLCFAVGQRQRPVHYYATGAQRSGRDRARPRPAPLAGRVGTPAISGTSPTEMLMPFRRAGRCRRACRGTHLR